MKAPLIGFACVGVVAYALWMPRRAIDPAELSSREFVRQVVDELNRSGEIVYDQGGVLRTRIEAAPLAEQPGSFNILQRKLRARIRQVEAQLTEMRATATEEDLGSIDYAISEAYLMRSIARSDARLQATIDELAIVIPVGGVVPSAPDGWEMSHASDQRNLFIYPLELARYPDYVAAKAHLSDLKQIALDQTIDDWNRQPIETRRAQIEAMDRANIALPAIRKEAQAYRDRGETIPDELQRRGEEIADALNRVHGGLDVNRITWMLAKPAGGE